MSKTACLQAIRRFCLSCMGGSPSLVRDCPDRACPLHDYRMQESPPEGRPLRAVRRHCMICAGGKGSVRACRADPDAQPEEQACLLWPHRLGLSRRSMKRLRALQSSARSLRLPGLENY